MSFKKIDLTSEWPKWPQYGPREASAVLRVLKSNQLFAADEVKTFERDLIFEI